MGSAGPLEEEAEEPQTLEQQHQREADKAAERQRAMEVVDRETDNDEERANRRYIGDEVQIQNGGKRGGEKKKQKACE